jgi:cell division protein FtsB
MDHDQLVFDLKHAPSLKLLRRDNAALIISFLYQAFKHAQVVSVAFNELVERLDACLDSLNDAQPGLYPLPAATYLKQWSSEEYQLLRIIARGNDDPVVELTVEAERAIGWIEERYRPAFVGTESRLRSIISLLEEIVAKSTEDVATRLRQLETERNAIQQEIDRLRASGQVPPSNSTEIKERFLLASEFARQMRRDFAEVEQNFRAIARALQERQFQPGTRKGELVGYMLDADAELRDSDQGRSFYAFWEFLMSPARQDALAELLEQIYGLSALDELVDQHPLLRRLTRTLIDAGEKIVQSNYRLAEQVRRLLDDRTQAESRRAAELIAEIKQHALRIVAQPPADDPFAELEGTPAVQLVMERPLWSPRAEVQLDLQPILEAAGELDESSLQLLYRQFYVDESLLRRQIETVLEHQPTCTLGEILDRFPAQKGLAEILGYLSIAAGDPRHRIDPATRDTMSLPAADVSVGSRQIRMPRVVFRSA